MKTEGRTRLRERHPGAAVMLPVTCLAFVVLCLSTETLLRNLTLMVMLTSTSAMMAVSLSMMTLKIIARLIQLQRPIIGD